MCPMLRRYWIKHCRSTQSTGAQKETFSSSHKGLHLLKSPRKPINHWHYLWCASGTSTAFIKSPGKSLAPKQSRISISGGDGKVGLSSSSQYVARIYSSVIDKSLHRNANLSSLAHPGLNGEPLISLGLKTWVCLMHVHTTPHCLKQYLQGGNAKRTHNQPRQIHFQIASLFGHREQSLPGTLSTAPTAATCPSGPGIKFSKETFLNFHPTLFRETTATPDFANEYCSVL